MSEDKKDETKDEVNDDKAEDTKEEEEKSDLINTNVALLKAELKWVKDDLAKEKLLTEELTKKLKQATDLIEDDTRAALIADIGPKTSVPQSLLAVKSVEALTEMKKVLDYAKVPAFKSGTPIVSANKSPEAKLYTMFDEWMEKHRK